MKRNMEIQNRDEHQEISPGARQVAEQTILETLELDKDVGLDDFVKKLYERIRTLSRYQEIKDKLKDISDQEMPYELFNLLRRASDLPKPEGGLDDGVLIRSMRQGHLECAGRSMIASALLKEHGIVHTLAKPPGHSLVLIEIDSITLAYADYNNDLYFTFPHSALVSYRGSMAVAECNLQAYKPRKKDYADGLARPYKHFMVVPAEEGVARTYLSNIAAAFYGEKEMANSGIAPNPKAAEAIETIAEEILGPRDTVWESFLNRSEELEQILERERTIYKMSILDVLKRHPSKKEFAENFSRSLQGELGRILPHLQKASASTRADFAEKLWDGLRDPRVAEEIKRVE